MNVRRKVTLAVAAAAVAVPALSACSLSGFNYATDRPNTIANGGFHTDGEVHVLAARIIAPSDGTGTFVATLTADATAEPVSFDSLAGVTTKKITPVDLKPNGMVNLYTAGGIPVTGDFKAGESVPVTLGFSDGEQIKVNAIVVTQCHEYAEPAIAGAESAETATAASPTEDHGSAELDSYNCEYAEAPAHSGSAH